MFKLFYMCVVYLASIWVLSTQNADQNLLFLLFSLKKPKNLGKIQHKCLICEQCTIVCYKLVQSFWVHFLFTGEYNTEDYGSFTGVI